MARASAVQQAKRRFLEEAGDRPWLMGVGIGKVDDATGLIISVKPGAKAAATRVTNQLELHVPVQIRAVEKIRARQAEPAETAAKQPTRAAGARLEALRGEALRRSR